MCVSVCMQRPMVGKATFKKGKLLFYISELAIVCAKPSYVQIAYYTAGLYSY